ncbi:MAG: uracil-DNA glycosylase, partial [Candidatus Scalindua sp.]
MSPSSKSTRLQKTKAEILSLLNGLSDKVDLERKLGMDYVQLAPIDIHNERNVDELSKPEKTKELNKLEIQVKKCTKCGLCEGRTNVVFGVGDPDADLMFIGEAPGYYEDVQGEPFVGRAGQLLTKIIESIGLKREEVYIANILKCRPPENRNPNASEIVLCTPHLIKQIEIIRPKVICALGTFA